MSCPPKTSTRPPEPDASTINGAVPLSKLRPGAAAKIQLVDSHDPWIAQRLLDLGFTPGTEVAVVRRAPLGDPTEYELRGYRIALRQSEGRHIWVRVE